MLTLYDQIALERAKKEIAKWESDRLWARGQRRLERRRIPQDMARIKRLDGIIWAKNTDLADARSRRDLLLAKQRSAVPA